MKTSKQRNPTKRRFLLEIALALLLMLIAISPVWSLSSRFGEQVIITANETIPDDLYVAGNTITIDGTVKGDAVLAGRSITINGIVEGDVIAAGQAVIINGSVGDDLRMAGQALILDTRARVADDAVAAGFSLENKAGSTVGGDLAFAGMQALLGGNVKQNVTGFMAALDLRGTVGGNAIATVGHQGDQPESFYPPFLPQPPVSTPKLRSGLTVADTARIGGKLTYKSTSAGRISQQAQIAGGVVRQDLEIEEARLSGQPNPAQILFWQLQRLLALLLVGWLLLRFLPGWTQNLVDIVRSQPLPSLGWGVVAFLGVGVLATVIAFATFLLTGLFAFTIPILIIPVIGIGTLANLTLLFGFMIFVFFVPQIAIALISGRWLLRTARSDTSAVVTLIIGLVAYVVLTAIPALGSLLSLITVLLGLGALWLWGRTKLNRVPADRQLTPV
jgi:cytoskeletal protein CcmA (bactofilin family)